MVTPHLRGAAPDPWSPAPAPDPVASAVVSLVSVISGESPPGRPEATTGSNGRFELEPVVPLRARMVLSVSHASIARGDEHIVIEGPVVEKELVVAYRGWNVPMGAGGPGSPPRVLEVPPPEQSSPMAYGGAAPALLGIRAR